MCGLMVRTARAVPSIAWKSGDAVVVLGATRAELGGSAYWEVVHDFVGGQPPLVDLDVARRLVNFLVAGAERGLFRSAHDCSQGGLGVALAEVAMGGPYQEHGFGLAVDLTPHAPLPTPELLFSESHGRAVVTCAPDRVAAVEALGREHGVPVHRAGTVGARDGELRVSLRDGVIAEPVARLREVYFSAIPRRMGD